MIDAGWDIVGSIRHLDSLTTKGNKHCCRKQCNGRYISCGYNNNITERECHVEVKLQHSA